MSHEKSTSIYTNLTSDTQGKTPWQYFWPNDADRPFNYTHLLKVTSDTGIARNTNPDVRIAIVGAGVAGLTTARELFRCGFRHIDIYEASERICGRLWSIPAKGQHAMFELGAMRMPFFPEPGSHNSLLDHYCRQYGLRTQDFPNPGSQFARTGIYMNDGFGPSVAMDQPPRMDIWEKEDQKPPLEILRNVSDKWSHFATLIQANTKDAYNAGGKVWEEMWRSIVKRYWDVSFTDLVFTPSYEVYDSDIPGDFGGLGMTGEEAGIFYVIGAGDGGWGAFFHVSALYPIRTLLFGYGTGYQLIQGRFDVESGEFVGGPHGDERVHDSNGFPLKTPGWRGVQSVAEGMFYYPVMTDEYGELSLYDAIQRDDCDVNLYCRLPVQELNKVESGVDLRSQIGTRNYNAVVLTCPTWALQLSVEFNGFDTDMLPLPVRTGLAQSHWITSCKVFFPLKARYWETSRIPQLMMTDSFIQGVYGYALETKAYPNEPGILLVSYTWEDDATKLMSIQNDDELARHCLAELDRICLRAKNIRQPISPFVDTSQTVVIHWSRQPTYAGCSKLYRARMWAENLALSVYNQECSAASSLYFAGDAFSVTSGWAESALRSAVDATIHIAKNLNGEFHSEFAPDRDYFHVDADWSPEEYAGSFRGVKSFAAGDTLCKEGDESEGMFLLLSGSVSVIKDGKELLVIDDNHVFLGYLSFFTHGKRTATMMAKTPCEVVIVTSDKIESLLKSAPNLALKLIRNLTEMFVDQLNLADTEN